MKMCHGVEFEALYSILADFHEPRGGLRGSSNKTEEGHRFNADVRGNACGIYFHLWAQRSLAQGYARWYPLCSDGNYMSAYFEVIVDRAYRVVYTLSTQKIQFPNHYHEDEGTSRFVDPDPWRNATLAGGPSIYYIGLHVEIVP